ncbi:MAG: HAD-IB family hydrolase [Clostridium sp.]|nr:HAD-IB family hydrolase [Clostridium sp.]
MKLAIFDVDYTLTKKETLLEFYKFLLTRNKKTITHIPVAILSGFLYLIKINDEKATKELFLKFLKGKTKNELNSLADDFFNLKIKNMLYKDGINKVKDFEKSGYTIVLTSASPELYINKFKNILNVDYIFGTELEFKDNIYTGNIKGLNNKGFEKINRLLPLLEKNDVDLKNSYMFSDSMADKPLLELVGNPYLVNYRKENPEYPVLKWK